ncbi:MAG TPA: PAS domain-containing protein [Dongiaceae bacterium]|jgi:hypothetical protein|nr:PAS domain-containing protein [Dongiaceae bacterium]
MATADFAIESQPDLEDPGLRLLYGYWHALAVAARGLPSLATFDPLHLPKLMPNMWILEVEPVTGRFRTRLAGENINAIYGRSIAGLYFRDVFEPADADIIVARYSRALSEPAVFHASGSVYAAGGALSVGERLGLPMMGRDGRTNTMLGATVYRSAFDMIAPVRLSDAQPFFHRIGAANHRAPEIAGG